MSNFKTRLLEEKAQLDERLAKLQTFQISDEFKKIPRVQQSLLSVQSQAMATYSQAIAERLSWMHEVGGSQA